MTNGHFFIISSDLNYKVGDFMAVVLIPLLVDDPLWASILE